MTTGSKILITVQSELEVRINNNMGDIGVHRRRKDIKTEIKYRNAWDLYWIQLDQDRAWSCEHGNEYSGFIEHEGFLYKRLFMQQ
jgi:hypothetical protein